MKRTHVALILDHSGSMGETAGKRQATISGFDEQVDVIKKNAGNGGATTLSLVLFNHDVTTPLLAQPAETLKHLDPDVYVPGGTTSMYDAVGHAISELRKLPGQDDPETAFLVIVVSDGLENSSKEYTGHQIAEMVKTCQDTGRWTFGYIGANQDLADVTKHLGIVAGNTMQYQATPAGMRSMYSGAAIATSTYFAKTRAAGGTQSASLYSGSGSPPGGQALGTGPQGSGGIDYYQNLTAPSSKWRVAPKSVSSEDPSEETLTEWFTE